jgi:hypothetical protein
LPHSKAPEGSRSATGSVPVPPPIGLALRDRALAELRAAEAHLARQGTARHEGVHQARKCLRRTRAILALAGPVLGKRGAALSEDIARLCRGLSALRDAQALLESLGRFAPVPADVQAILPDAVAAAGRQRDALLARSLLRDPDLVSRRLRIARFRQRIARLDWAPSSDRTVGRALARSLRRARKAARRLGAEPGDSAARHRFRRRLRRLHQQNTMLGDVAPALRLKAPALEQQATALGEAQDCQLLLARCGRHSPFAPGQRRALRRLARQRLAALQHQHRGER